jgi:hypothetical protein
MTVSVTPSEFTMVMFDAPAIARVAEQLLERLDLQRDLRIDVDETTPVARVVVQSTDPLVVTVESGAFEDSKRPRHLSELITATNLARVLLRVRDREHPGFEASRADADLTLAQAAAWDTYAIGRFGRLGYEVHQPRWRYNFRNRHGFSDAADQAFDQLWAATELTWAELEALSASASAATSAS